MKEVVILREIIISFNCETEKLSAYVNSEIS